MRSNQPILDRRFVPPVRCDVCGVSAPGLRLIRDGAGLGYCDSCFRRVKSGADERPGSEEARFRCSVCNTPTLPRELREVGEQLICRTCLASAPDETQIDTEPGLPEIGQTPSTTVMDAAAIVASLEGPVPGNVLPKLTCPHCWNVFPPEEILWISQHSELLGDPVLGAEAAVRFRPSRFNAKGEALDGRDVPCQHLACPRCHLELPRAVIEAEPLFMSIVGAPASGKSHLLAAMTWSLRRLLPEKFSLAFNDADTLSNHILAGYEQTLFFADDTDNPVAIRKTELHGELYDEVRLGQQIISLPRPFLFTLRHTGRPMDKTDAARMRVMCLYDNAGEHFHPGMDSLSSPGTQHLAKSRVLLFLFDPTQNPRFRDHCRTFSFDPQLYGASRTERQETILTESAQRVRRYVGLSPHKKHDRPLLVIVSKADIWAPLLDANIDTEPLISVGDGSSAAVDLPRIEETSRRLRTLLKTWAPEFVAAAEDFCHTVLYVPVSALGRGPELKEETGLLTIRPRDIHPKWVTVPVLYMLAKWASGLLPAARAPHAEKVKVQGVGGR
jgi:hypothetical protein